MKMSNLRIIYSLSILLGCSNFICGNNVSKANDSISQPNFIIFYVDNLGYGDIEPFGSKLHRTPNLSKLAKEGTRFTQFYSTSGVCSPSRASLMTGCYPRRVNLHTSGNGGVVLRPVDSVGLNPNEITIAELLKKAGYATGIIGKWHLGDQIPFLPTNQGFDYYFGIPYSDDMTQEHEGPLSKAPPLPLMRNELVIEAPVDRDYLTQRETGEAIKFIKNNKENLFFLYLPQAMPGSTKAPFSSPGFKGKSNNGAWGDSVDELDWSAGEIIRTLKELHLDKKTIVIWTSDNGAPKREPTQGSNRPLGGWGYTTAEGGHRVPMIAWAPGIIPAGKISEKLATTMDFYVTFAELAGGEIPRDRIIDGKNIKDILLGKPESESPYEAFYYYDGPQLQAIRYGRWKLYLSLDNKIRTRQEQKQYQQLYDVIDDPGETEDVHTQHPELVLRIQKMAEDARKDLGDGNGIIDFEGLGQRPPGKVINPTPRILECNNK